MTDEIEVLDLADAKALTTAMLDRVFHDNVDPEVWHVVYESMAEKSPGDLMIFAIEVATLASGLVFYAASVDNKDPFEFLQEFNLAKKNSDD